MYFSLFFSFRHLLVSSLIRPNSASFRQCRRPPYLIFTSHQFFISANLPQLVGKRESCTSLPFKHLTYPSVALHVPDVIPFPRHHERVHRHLAAQPRREASWSVRATSSGQCFRNPLHVLPAIKIKRRPSQIENWCTKCTQ